MPDDEARGLPIVIDGATLRGFGSTTWMTDAGPLDVLHELPTAGGGRGYGELVGRSDDFALSGIVVSVASLDDIIDSKMHANRPKDREALPELHELRRQRDEQ